MLSMPGELPIICFALHLLIGLQVDGRGEKGSLNKSWLHDGRESVMTCAALSSNFRKSIEKASELSHARSGLCRVKNRFYYYRGLVRFDT